MLTYTHSCQECPGVPCLSLATPPPPQEAQTSRPAPVASHRINHFQHPTRHHTLACFQAHCAAVPTFVHSASQAAHSNSRRCRSMHAHPRPPSHPAAWTSPPPPPTAQPRTCSAAARRMARWRHDSPHARLPRPGRPLHPPACFPMAMAGTAAARAAPPTDCGSSPLGADRAHCASPPLHCLSPPQTPPSSPCPPAPRSTSAQSARHTHVHGRRPDKLHPLRVWLGCQTRHPKTLRLAVAHHTPQGHCHVPTAGVSPSQKRTAERPPPSCLPILVQQARHHPPTAHRPQGTAHAPCSIVWRLPSAC